MVFDFITPDKTRSELENRQLAQFPKLTAESLAQNEWTLKYEDYVKDQFAMRDDWVSLWSLLEAGQGKLETGGVWLAKDGYQIAKNDVWTTAQRNNFPRNVQAVSELATRHPNQVDVLIAPSPANILSDLLRGNPQQIDENGMMDDMFAQFRQAGARVVDVRLTFEAHKGDTQLYYRTDHHWTTEGGAWLAYAQYCELNDKSPILPPQEMLLTVEDFYGTNYSKTKLATTMPDTLYYYDFDNELRIYEQQADGATNLVRKGGIMDEEKLSTYDKYAAFLWGNNGYSELDGNGEGSILVIKDSYGNCFIPYLTQNYAKIGIVDLRAWNTSLISLDALYEQGGYERMLLLYNFPTFSADMFAYRMMDAANNVE
jgi:hypothetical protein